MTRIPDQPSQPFTQEDARNIIARAIALEQLRTDDLSLAELKHAALEVGISESALETAIATYQRPEGEQLGHLPRLIVHGAAAGGGLAVLTEWALPLLTTATPLDGAPLAVFLWLMLSGSIAAIRSPHGSKLGFLEFQARNFGIFAGLVVATLALTGALNGLPDGGLMRWMMIAMLITLWGATSAVGGIIASWRSRSIDSAATPPQQSGWVRRLKEHVSARLRSWSDLLLRCVAVQRA